MGSRMLQLAARTDAAIAQYIASRGIPDAIATSDWNTVTELAYLDDATVAVRNREEPDASIGVRAMTEKEQLWLQSSVSAEQIRSAMLWEPEKVVADFARVYTITRKLLTVLPEHDPNTSGYYDGFVTRPARGAIAADFGGDIDVTGEVVVWIDPQGPASGRIDIGDIVTNRTLCPSSNGNASSAQCRQLTLVRRKVERQTQIELESLPIHVEVGLSDAPYANAWVIITPETRRLLVSTGMLGIIRNDDELAFVIGHELGHLLPARDIYPRPATSQGFLGSIAATFSPRSRHDQEMEADCFALHLMYAAGYKAESASVVISRLATMVEADSYNLTHPPGPVRIAAMKATLAELGRGTGNMNTAEN